MVRAEFKCAPELDLILLAILLDPLHNPRVDYSARQPLSSDAPIIGPGREAERFAKRM